MDLRKVLVYVSGPISKGCIIGNVRQAHDAATALMKAGLSVIVPHGSCFFGNRVSAGAFIPEITAEGLTWQDWIEMDLEIISRCDCVLRLPGESKGADAEVAEAVRLNKSVFYGVDDVVSHYERTRGAV